MVKGMEHVAIFAADTKKLTDWYKDMFGLREVYNNGKGTIFLGGYGLYLTSGLLNFRT